MSAGQADKHLDTFKVLVWDLWVRAAITYVLGLAAWLTIGPVAFLATKLIVYITDVLYGFVRDGINIGMIMLNNELHHTEYVKASNELKSMFDKYGPDSKEFKDEREAHKIALSRFVRFS